MNELQETLLSILKGMRKQGTKDGNNEKKPFLLMKDSDHSIIKYGDSFKELVVYAIENGLSAFEVTPLLTEEYEERFGKAAESKVTKEKKSDEKSSDMRTIGPFHIGKTIQLKDQKKGSFCDDEILDFMQEVEADILHFVDPSGKDKICFILKGVAYEAKTRNHRKAVTMLMRHLSKKP